MARYETRNEGYVHHPRYTGCLHRNRMLYTSLTLGLFLSAESVNRRLPQSAACHHDTVDSGGRAGSVASHTVGMFHTSIRPLVLRVQFTTFRHAAAANQIKTKGKRAGA